MDQTLERLAEMGAGFVLLRPRSKRPLERGWPERPRRLACAAAHLARGGNVGLLAGHGGWVTLDLDADFDHFRARFAARLKALPLVGRTDAPARGKVLLRVRGELQNRVWRPDPAAVPTLELLAQRRVAALPPSHHPAGEQYRWLTREWAVPVVEAEQVAAWWQAWTGAPWSVSEPTPRRKAIRDRPGPAGRTVARVRHQWPSAWAVFHHWGRAEVVLRKGEEWRLCHQGGLLVGDPASDVAWRWYCHAEGIGGDPIDAWGWCRFGAQWDRYNGALFRAVLVEMISQ